MPNIFCVRADSGTLTDYFVRGGYIAIGWEKISDLGDVKSPEKLNGIYKAAYPEDTSNLVIGQQVGQLKRFLFEIQPKDYVITPDADTELLHIGVVQSSPFYFYDNGGDGCRYRHRRPVKWLAGTFMRSAFSIPFQNTMRVALTVFSVSHKANFFEVIGEKELAPDSPKPFYDPYPAVLNQLWEKLDANEFEILITKLLEAIGFEAEHTGKTGDGGVDAKGELNIANLAKIKLFVQVKRYKIGIKIAAKEVKAFRQSIPADAQGAFITTADFQANASDIALEKGFPRIGLVNGRQLVDLLIEHWPDIPEEFKNKLALQQGLVLA